jgi:hypothetical protein
MKEQDKLCCARMIRCSVSRTSGSARLGWSTDDKWKRVCSSLRSLMRVESADQDSDMCSIKLRESLNGSQLSHGTSASTQDRLVLASALGGARSTLQVCIHTIRLVSRETWLN